MIRYCAQCDQTFEAAKAWHRLCWTCWRANKDRGAWADGYAAGLAADRHNQPLSGRDLHDLIVLVHPDHQPPERGEMANRLTAKLIAMRAGLDAA